MDGEQLISEVCALDPALAAVESGVDRPTVTVSAERLLPVMRQLRDVPALAFQMLLDHVAVDWPDEDCFELVYQLYSLTHNHYLMVTVRVPREQPVLPSVSSVWACAEFQEREVYDLFGILYDEHPDLRRLFLEDEWEGFPLRKDYQDDFILERPK
jgi:NADH-quinone oxidoreductase subunit C